MMWRTRVLVGVTLLALALLGLVFSQRRPVSAVQGVKEAIERFVQGIEERRIQDAVRTLSPDFTWEGATRGEVSRGLLVLNRDFDEVNIILTGVAVTPTNGDEAVAVVKVAVSAWQDGREMAVGIDEPVTVTVSYERRGRRWLATRASGGPSLHSYGYR